MAERGGTAQVVTAAAVAAGTGAAQLGLGYGLGVVVWPTSATMGDDTWLSSLGWATWIAAVSVVVGAVTGYRGRPTSAAGVGGSAPRGPWRVAVALAAAAGALPTVALIAVPARTAVRQDTFSPQIIAAGYAAVGIAAGLAVAYWALVSRPVAANVIVTAGWFWLVPVAAVGHGLVTRRPLTGAHLGGWWTVGPDPGWNHGAVWWPGALLTLSVALVIGALAAWPAVRRREYGTSAASSGAVGPLLVALAFLVLAPHLAKASAPMRSAFLIAPYAVLTGLAGSAAMVGLARRATARRRDATPPSPSVRTADVSPDAAVESATVESATVESAAVESAASRRPSTPEPVARTPEPAARAAASVAVAARPVRSTVAAPPPAPAVAQIDPPASSGPAAGPAPLEPSTMSSLSAPPGRSDAPPVKATARAPRKRASRPTDSP